MVTPERLRLAREINGLTQTDLARRVEGLGLGKIAQSTIAAIETGRWEPSTEILEAIGRVTGFDVDYFNLPDLPEFPSGSLLLHFSRPPSRP